MAARQNDRDARLSIGDGNRFSTTARFTGLWRAARHNRPAACAPLPIAVVLRASASSALKENGGRHELYNLQNDLGEKEDVSVTNPAIIQRLEGLMRSYIDPGRSTPGTVQKNEFTYSLDGGMGKGKKKNTKANTANQ